MKKLIITTALLISNGAMASDYAVGIGAGTFGAGVDFTYNASDRVNIRALLHGGEFSAPDYEADEIEYTGDAELGGQALFVDFFPLGGKFRFSAGLINNVSELRANARAATINVGNNGDTLTDGEAAIDLEVVDGVVPYFGIGWGNPVSDGIPLGFSIDIGVIPADPVVDFELISGVYTTGDTMINVANGAVEGGVLSGTLTPEQVQNTIDSAIQQEISNINNEDLDDINFYPIINLALTYQF